MSDYMEEGTKAHEALLGGGRAVGTSDPHGWPTAQELVDAELVARYNAARQTIGANHAFGLRAVYDCGFQDGGNGVNADLLQALEAMVESYEYEASMENPALLQARAAIAKAKP